MRNVYEPTNHDIMEWLDSGVDVWPASDWDYYVMNGLNDQLVFSLANDKNCSKREFFVHCLYYIVGDFIVEGAASEDIRSRIDVFLCLARDDSNCDVLLWKQRTESILNGDEVFDSCFWLGYLFNKDSN